MDRCQSRSKFRTAFRSARVASRCSSTSFDMKQMIDCTCTRTNLTTRTWHSRLFQNVHRSASHLYSHELLRNTQKIYIYIIYIYKKYIYIKYILLIYTVICCEFLMKGNYSESAELGTQTFHLQTHRSASFS